MRRNVRLKRSAVLVRVLGMTLASLGAALQVAHATPADEITAAGRVKMKCFIAAQGRVRDCVVLEEVPKGAGLGDAALKMSEQFRINRKMIGGRRVEGGTIIIPVVFQAPPEPPLPLP